MSLTANCRWFHIVDAHEILEPRTGLFLQRPAYSGNWWEISLVFAVTGRTPRLFFVDYNSGVTVAKPVWWMVVGFRQVPKGYRNFFYYAGVKPLDTGPLVEQKMIVLYKNA